jgi:amino acid transporter
MIALANDGLLPSIFGELDVTGNPKKGALIAGETNLNRFFYYFLSHLRYSSSNFLPIFAGVCMTIFATFVPFSYLEDFVSAGILMAFTVTNSSLIILRRRSPDADPNLLQKYLAWFNLFSFLTCLAVSHVSWIIGCLLGPVSVLIATKISRQCPPATSFGNANSKTTQWYAGKKYFSTPFVPYIPCLGIFVNYFLISQLAFIGIALLFAYVLLFVLLYFLYGAHNSVGRKEGWEEQEYSMVESDDNKSHETKKEGVMT